MPSCRDLQSLSNKPLQKITTQQNPRGPPMATLTPLSLAKMYFISKRILRKEGLKNVYNLLGSFLLTSRCDKYYITSYIAISNCQRAQIFVYARACRFMAAQTSLKLCGRKDQGSKMLKFILKFSYVLQCVHFGYPSL